MKRNKKAFTLIELVSVLVILAILALIVTPLVLNIIRKARNAADKRSIDTYGRSIELAVADYLLDNGTFPTSIEELQVEYSGDRVVCETTKLNSDSSVYLSGCTVNSRIVDYAYGKEEIIYKSYSIGDEVTYNGIDFYVINDSDSTEQTVTLLKAEPLTTEEVNEYGGVGTENNHVNLYVTTDTSSPYYRKAYDHNGYGGVAFYSSQTCNQSNSSGCTTNYDESEIKYIINTWSSYNLKESDLAEDSSGYSVRILNDIEFINNFNYEFSKVCDTCGMSWMTTENTPIWVYYDFLNYMTMSADGDSNYVIKTICKVGIIPNSVYSGNDTIRPVVTIKKSALN